MTFSIAARCPRTGAFGLAVASSSPAVAARCAFVRAGVGAVATQNITDPRLGPRGLDLLATGLSARDAMARLCAAAPHIAFRQLAMVDAHGGTAAFSGERTLGLHRTAEGSGVVAAGNLLKSPELPARMVAAFDAASELGLGDRLLRAMRAGVEAGGEQGPVHSAGIVMALEMAWPVADLRVDWDDADPIARLADLWRIWAPQMDAYVTRALDPEAAVLWGAGRLAVAATP